MSSKIRSIDLDKLVPHPDNPNRMSKAVFAKLVRNIERTGRYEPLIVKRVSGSRCSGSPCASVFQIINGHHRWLALKELGHKTADAIVWDIDDAQADILLATLNRLCGQDVLDKKIALLSRLSEKMKTNELAKFLPQTKKQIEKLTNLRLPRVSSIKYRASVFANPLVFFVSDSQKQVIEDTLNYALPREIDDNGFISRGNKSSKRASALSAVCRYYLDHKPQITSKEL